MQQKLIKGFQKLWQLLVVLISVILPISCFSTIKQTFTLTDPSNAISFAWAFLTNDFDEVELSVDEDGFEGRDFGFYTFYETSSLYISIEETIKNEISRLYSDLAPTA